jgi:transcriptional regulator with XRE-family HTH domain
MPGTRQRELADLLRSRRDRLRPDEVGLPAGVRRRTTGLRREEVAVLAGISTTYYTFLEQGRDVRPSEQVLLSLAAALRLSPAERAHLYQLAGVVPPAEDGTCAETLDPVLAEMVARQDPYPSYVTGRRWDVLVANRTARVLFTDWSAKPVADRNMLVWMFTDPEARLRYQDWPADASALLGRFRAVAARRPDDPAFAELVDRLHRASPQVREWWPRHEVRPIAGGVKRLWHPALGPVSLRHVVLQVAGHPDQKLVSYAGEPGVHTRLAELAAELRSEPVPASGA